MRTAARRLEVSRATLQRILAGGAYDRPLPMCALMTLIDEGRA